LLIEIAPGIDVQTVTVDELLEGIGKLVDVRHRSAFHEDWNDRHPVTKSRLDFDANRIRWIVNPAPQPMFADDDECDISLNEHGVDIFAKADAQRNVVAIPKYRAGTIMSR
jgi:hypothetical protein